MTLSQRLSEFQFNLETFDLLLSMGRSVQQVTEEMKGLGFTSNHVNFILNSRMLLNSVLLRCKLYSEQNLKEATVRSNLSVLNNTVITSFLDRFFFVKSSEKQNEVLEIVTQPVVQPVVQHVDEDEHVSDEEGETVEESSRFDQFFKACVKQTQDNTDVVKSTEFYNAFSEWWNGIYEESVPDKNELKEFLNGKLGKPNKNTWSNVCMV
jgi:hypothetical protein